MLSGQQVTTNIDTAVSEEIKLFSIENKNGTKLVVSNYGAAVQSFFCRDRSGKSEDIVLGYGDLNDYASDPYYFGTVVGRYANRIAGSKVVINDKLFHLSVNGDGYHQHGGFEGFNKKLFRARPFEKEGSSGIVFTGFSSHLEEGFPGELDLEVTYTLDDGDVWSVEYKAVSTEDTLINLTQHTYFNLSGDLSNKIDGHSLRILSQHYLPVNKLQVPLGEIAHISGTPFDFTKFKKIGQEIDADNEQLLLSNGYDHTFVLEKEHTGVLKHAAIVKEPLSGRKLDVFTTEPAIHFYSGNFISNVTGKNNITYNKRSGFCLETQHFPDAPNHSHFPSTLLKAGESFYSKTLFKFSVE